MEVRLAGGSSVDETSPVEMLRGQRGDTYAAAGLGAELLVG